MSRIFSAILLLGKLKGCKTMDETIKMPEALAAELSRDEEKMNFFDSLSDEEKLDYIIDSVK